MHGLPENLDLSFFVDCDLTEVAFHEFEIALKFTNHVSIHLDCRFELGPDQRPERMDPTALLDLVGCPVTTASRVGEGDLHLGFACQKWQELTIKDNNREVVSYRIVHVERVIEV